MKEKKKEIVVFVIRKKIKNKKRCDHERYENISWIKTTNT